MSQEDTTYVRAKLGDINNAIERLTEMLNRMIEVISKITEVQEAQSDILEAVAANTSKVDELTKLVAEMPVAAPVSTSGASSPADVGQASTLLVVLETLESQIREGAIASDLAKKINEATDTLEQRGATSQILVKMGRWTRILRTYGRVDPISASDLSKLRNDLKSWMRDIGGPR